MTFCIQFRCQTNLILVGGPPCQRLVKFSIDREQDFRPNFAASALDGEQKNLAETNPAGKIEQHVAQPPHAPNRPHTLDSVTPRQEVTMVL